MSKRITAEISTTNKNLKGEDGKDLEIKVSVEVEVPETLEEAANFYGSEEKLLDSIQTDVARRKSNAARPLLRDAEGIADWQVIAQQAVDSYTPGRRGGFGSVAVSEDELSSATSMSDLLALLRAKGIQITGSAPESNEENAPVEELVGSEG